MNIMKIYQIFVATVALCATVVQAGTVSDESVSRDGRTVSFRSCAKCPARIRLSNDGRHADVNLARLADDGTTDKTVLAARKAALTDRAFRLMASVADVGETKRTRPLMGWSSWNTFGCNISEALILETARAMATNGLAKAGYRYVNIDDGYFAGHGADGKLRINLKRFPKGLKPVVDGVHALGLKAGIYSDAGSDTCGSLWSGDKTGLGSGFYRHDDADAQFLFDELGFDFIKVDYCGGIALQLDERERYTAISRAIRRAGRDVRFNVCRWAYPGTWVSDIAESWRTTGDIRANWGSVSSIVRQNVFHHPYSSVGHYNDMDMLEVGHRLGKTKTGFGASDAGLTEGQEIAHFGLWAMMSSPLLIGCDARTIPSETLELVTNPYVLAMNQNDLGLGARPVRQDAARIVFVKDADRLYGTARYLGLVNFSTNAAPATFRIPLAELELGGKVALLDLVARTDLGEVQGELVLDVPPASARFLRLDAATRLPRTVYEAEDAFLTGFQRILDSAVVKSPEVVGAKGGSCVRGLGGRAANDLVWRDVCASETGEYELKVETLSKGEFFILVDGGNLQPGEKPLKVRLEKGLHTVRLVNNKAAMPDIDRLTVVPAR